MGYDLYDDRFWVKSYPPSIKKSIEFDVKDIKPLHIGFENAAEEYSKKDAIIYLGKRITFDELKKLIDKFSASLYNIGLKPKDKFVIYIPNCPQWIIAYYALQKIGAVPVPITPIYTPNELEYICRDSHARGILCSDVNFDYVMQVLPKTNLEIIIYTNLADLVEVYKKFFGKILDRIPSGRIENMENVFSFKKLIKGHGSPPQIDIDPKSYPAYILYTGGTTGNPKGVIGTHYTAVAIVTETYEWFKNFIKDGEHIAMVQLPLFHIFGQLVVAVLNLHSGNTIVLMPKLNLDALLDSVRRYKVTLFYGVPALYNMILDHDRLDQYDLTSLKYCFSGGDVLPSEVFMRWKSKFDLPIYQIYGSTETGNIAISPLDREPIPGCVGLPLPTKRIKIVDPDTHEPVPINTPGELWVHADYLVKEYWNKPEETEKSFVLQNGILWYRMKDIVRMDEKGYLYFVDRAVDLIKYKGYRISASEIEAVLLNHPAVKEVCVIGVPDKKVGERIKAFVVLNDDVRGVTASDLIKWCRENLVPYKVPDYIEFRDMLPKSKVGKVLRRELREKERKKTKEVITSLTN